MSARPRNVPLVTAVVATAAVLGLLLVHDRVTPLPGLGKLEDMTIDGRFALRGPRPPASDRIVIVGVDDDTRARDPDVFQTRRGWARLIRALARYDAKIIALDLFFDTPEVILPAPLSARVRAEDDRLRDAPPEAAPPELRALVHDVAGELRGDDELAAAIADAHRVFLGAYFRDPGGRTADAEPPGLALARHGEVADAGGGGQRRPVGATHVAFTLPAIARGATGAGAVNSFHDADGVVRRVPLAIGYGDAYYMPLGLAVALADLGRPADTTYLVGEPSLEAAGRTLPLGEAASIDLDFLGRDAIPHVSAAAVLAGTAPKDALAGKLAFVGFTYSTSDKVATPLDKIADGIELHATLAENVLAGRVMHHAGSLALFAATALLGALVALSQLRRVRRRAWVPPAVAAVALAGYVALAQLVFARGTIVEVAPPIAAALVVLAAATIANLATEGREKAQLRAVFSQYVSRAVVDRILADPARARLGGERKELTVLFSDIRGFSAFAENMKPEELATFLGEYLTPMSALVLESGGTLDKYIGDAVMAIWSAPVDVPDHAARACEVALRMQEALVALNQSWRERGKPAIAIGIGINTGAMAVGNMGSAARFDYTVLGDQVNLAARLEALTKEYGAGILVGEATARAAGAAFVFRELDVVRVKGRAAAAPVFELVGRVGAARVERAFGEALAAYRRREFAAARAQFAALAGEHADPAAAALAARCDVLAAEPPPDGWDGVYEQRSK
ncbi:MAG TPA: adenylate/guanylate cyclase domain-containing protein [Kofleriaceae bacterium]|nr:adenylate/guanylate cyclase domain-containing protein [Kofleriaceae bacterium]